MKHEWCGSEKFSGHAIDFKPFLSDSVSFFFPRESVSVESVPSRVQYFIAHCVPPYLSRAARKINKRSSVYPLPRPGEIMRNNGAPGGCPAGPTRRRDPWKNWSRAQINLFRDTHICTEGGQHRLGKRTDGRRCNGTMTKYFHPLRCASRWRRTT